MTASANKEKKPTKISYPKFDYDLAAEALRHLANKVRALKNDEDIKERNNITIAVDLDHNAEDIEKIARQLELTDESGRRYEKLGKLEREIICHALDVYLNDLRGSKATILKKLGIADDKYDDYYNKIAQGQDVNYYYFSMKTLEELIHNIEHARDEIFYCPDHDKKNN